jgi:hypothetical protein
MAKHPHRLILNQKKTWRCTLPGCTYFIHLGLAHTLPGRLSICWECNEEFTLDDEALKDDMPKCDNCRRKMEGGPSRDEVNEYYEVKLAMGRAKVKHISELSPTALSLLKSMNNVSDRTIEKFMSLPKEDQIEVIEP